jgi:hypothetical protein
MAPDNGNSRRFRPDDTPTFRFEIEVVNGEIGKLLAAERARAIREALIWFAECAASTRKSRPAGRRGDVVDLDAPLGQQLLDVPVGQPEAQVPADRQHDHLRREPKPGERRPRRAGNPDAAVRWHEPHHPGTRRRNRALQKAENRPASGRFSVLEFRLLAGAPHCRQ